MSTAEPVYPCSLRPSGCVWVFSCRWKWLLLFECECEFDGGVCLKSKNRQILKYNIYLDWRWSSKIRSHVLEQSMITLAVEKDVIGTYTPDIKAPLSTHSQNRRHAGNAYAGPSTMGGCTGTETDKQIGLWERRIKGLRRMLLGWEQARPPDTPCGIQLDVTSCTSVTMRIQESLESPIATKCKGECECVCVCVHRSICLSMY